MERFIDRIFRLMPSLAADLFGDPGVPHQAGPLVVVDAQEVLESLRLEMWLGPLREPTCCSPGSRRVFIEFGKVQFEVDPHRPHVHGWLITGRGPRPGVSERVRASLVVEHDIIIVGPELQVDLDLDESGGVIGWPGPLAHRWATPSSAWRVVGSGHFLSTLHPALVALERLNADGDSIRSHAYPRRRCVNRSEGGLRPLFPYVTPSPRI